MVTGSTTGAYLGDISKLHPILFISFVSFGVVALLYLCCHELLIEANEIQKGSNKWWISICVFLGVYVVIVTDLVFPK